MITMYEAHPYVNQELLIRQFVSHRYLMVFNCTIYLPLFQTWAGILESLSVSSCSNCFGG